jgi:hypothetical protein
VPSTQQVNSREERKTIGVHLTPIEKPLTAYQKTIDKYRQSLGTYGQKETQKIVPFRSVKSTSN